jgi:hypothetical protein
MAICPPTGLEIPRPPIEAPLHGLIDTAYTPELSDLPEELRGRWEAGISFFPNPLTCDPVTPWLPWTDDPADKPVPGSAAEAGIYHTYQLIYTTHCNAAPGAIDGNIAAALDALEVGTGQAVEAVFWGPTGPLADLFYPDDHNFSLSGSTPLVTGYDAGSCTGIVNQNALAGNIVAFTPKQALLALTQQLGNCAIGARGFLHAPPYVAEDWASESLVRLSDKDDVTSPLITNVRGDYVVGGSGYSGIGPAGHVRETPADGHAWVYATGPVGVLLSEPTVQETTLIDHSNNLHKIIVERTVAIAASRTCLFAAYVDVA